MSNNVCSNCGLPDGDHYNLCFNSVHYYSPEQERQDDVHYGEDDHRERYAATAEPSQYAADEADADPRMYDVTTNWPLPNPVNDDDIPF